jgi:hypothetical protein
MLTAASHSLTHKKTGGACSNDRHAHWFSKGIEFGPDCDHGVSPVSGSNSYRAANC